ncbi:hypothetical protein ACOMHN_014282 [Nucella lapillus]
MRLMQGADFLNRGHHLSLDNYFSSSVLFQALHHQHTTATGTVRTHRRGLPRDAIARRLINQQTPERRKGPLLCVAYQDGKRKPVLLSTVARAGFTEVQNRQKSRTEGDTGSRSPTLLLCITLQNNGRSGPWYMFMVSVVESLAGNYRPPQKVVRRRCTAAEVRAPRDNPHRTHNPSLGLPIPWKDMTW